MLAVYTKGQRSGSLQLLSLAISTCFIVQDCERYLAESRIILEITMTIVRLFTSTTSWLAYRP